MENYSDLMVFGVMKTLKTPPTLKGIIAAVARKCGITQEEVHDRVKNILEAGIQHGLVHKEGGKYILDAVVENGENEANDESGTENENDDEEPTDAGRRRRRRRSRSRRRSGSRRRRSRRRRH